MTRRTIWATLVALCWVSGLSAQETAWRFRWKPNQVLVYRVEQSNQATEVLDGKTIVSKTKMNLVKSWQVKEVDATGVALLENSLVSLQLETTTPMGETLTFDSTNPDKSSPEMKEQLGRYVGVPLAVLRIDALGRVIEVKESKFGPASRFESELPFLISLPGTDLKPTQTWQRDYTITLEPPQGTGEKFPASQKYTCQRIQGSGGYVSLTTEIKKLPEALADQIPLVRGQPQGEIAFDLHNGRFHSAVLRVQKELKNHQGEGTSYRYDSTYTEVYTGDK